MAVSLFLATALAACGADPGGPATGSADCQQGVQLDGVTYTEVGYLHHVDHAGDRAGDAALGECDDQGEDPAGLTFPDDARTVDVWTVSGADPAEAVARKTANGWQVFVSDALGNDERAQVTAALGLEG